MKLLLAFIALFMVLESQAQYRVYAPHYPEGIVTNAIDGSPRSITFKPVNGTRKINIRRTNVLRIEYPDKPAYQNTDAKIQKSYTLPIHPLTGHVYYKDSVQVDSASAQYLHALIQSWRNTDKIHITRHEKSGPNWSITYRKGISAFQSDREYIIFYDLHTVCENGQITIEFSNFKLVWLDKIHSVYPGPVQDHADYPVKYAPDLDRSYHLILRGLYVESFWSPLKKNLWDKISAFHLTASSPLPYDRFDYPNPSISSPKVEMITTNRSTIDIQLAEEYDNILVYRLSDDTSKTLRYEDIQRVYGIRDEQGKLVVHSHRSRHESNSKQPYGDVFIFDQNGIYFELLGALTHFKWEEKTSTSKPTILEDHSLTTLGLRFGKTWHFTGIPDVYSYGAQFSAAYSMAFDHDVAINAITPRIGFINTFKTSNNTALDLNLNVGASILFWDIESDGFIEQIFLPQSSTGTILLSPEVKFRYRNFVLGSGYDYGLFPKSNINHPELNALYLSLGYRL